jgi:hypothetical protein
MQLTAKVSGVYVFPASVRILFELLGLFLTDPWFVKCLNNAPQMLTTPAPVQQLCILLWVHLFDRSSVRYRVSTVGIHVCLYATAMSLLRSTSFIGMHMGSDGLVLLGWNLSEW